MASSEEQIKSDIKAHIKKRGGEYSDWYVGIAADPRDRLFNGHGVDEKKDSWIYKWADSSSVARRVEEYFVNTLGTDGGTGGGSEDTKAVYAYKKSSRTDP